MTDYFAIEEWGSVANYEREMCGAGPADYDSDSDGYSYCRDTLCQGCGNFDITDARCEAYPTLTWEMFRRKWHCKHQYDPRQSPLLE